MPVHYQNAALQLRQRASRARGGCSAGSQPCGHRVVAGHPGKVGRDAVAVDVRQRRREIFAHSEDERAAILQLVHALYEALAVGPAQDIWSGEQLLAVRCHAGVRCCVLSVVWCEASSGECLLGYLPTVRMRELPYSSWYTLCIRPLPYDLRRTAGQVSALSRINMTW